MLRAPGNTTGVMCFGRWCQDGCCHSVDLDMAYCCSKYAGFMYLGVMVGGGVLVAVLVIACYIVMRRAERNLEAAAQLEAAKFSNRNSNDNTSTDLSSNTNSTELTIGEDQSPPHASDYSPPAYEDVVRTFSRCHSCDAGGSSVASHPEIDVIGILARQQSEGGQGLPPLVDIRAFLLHHQHNSSQLLQTAGLPPPRHPDEIGDKLPTYEECTTANRMTAQPTREDTGCGNLLPSKTMDEEQSSSLDMATPETESLQADKTDCSNEYLETHSDTSEISQHGCGTSDIKTETLEDKLCAIQCHVDTGSVHEQSEENLETVSCAEVTSPHPSDERDTFIHKSISDDNLVSRVINVSPSPPNDVTTQSDVMACEDVFIDCQPHPAIAQSDSFGFDEEAENIASTPSPQSILFRGDIELGMVDTPVLSAENCDNTENHGSREEDECEKNDRNITPQCCNEADIPTEVSNEQPEEEEGRTQVLSTQPSASSCKSKAAADDGTVCLDYEHTKHQVSPKNSEKEGSNSDDKLRDYCVVENEFQRAVDGKNRRRRFKTDKFENEITIHVENAQTSLGSFPLQAMENSPNVGNNNSSEELKDSGGKLHQIGKDPSCVDDHQPEQTGFMGMLRTEPDGHTPSTN